MWLRAISIHLLALLLSTLFSTVFSISFAQTPIDSSSENIEKESDKLDIKKLEEKYWSAKDNDFSVVQNRAFTKAEKYYINLAYGPLINDGYSTGKIKSMRLGYYFSEQWGLEISNEQAELTTNATTDYFLMNYGVSPNYNKYISSNIIKAHFVPFYAKMSFLDKKIIYFDMSISAGFGSLNYEAQTDVGPISRSSTVTEVDISQHLFFTEQISLRLDLQNKFSTQDLFKYHIQNGADESTRSIGNQGQQDTSLLIGLTYFFK